MTRAIVFLFSFLLLFSPLSSNSQEETKDKQKLISIETPLRDAIQKQLDHYKVNHDKKTFEQINNAFWASFDADIRNLNKKLPLEDSEVLIEQLSESVLKQINSPHRNKEITLEDYTRHQAMRLARFIGFSLNRDDLIPCGQYRELIISQANQLIDEAKRIVKAAYPNASDMAIEETVPKLLNRNVAKIEQPLAFELKRLLSDEEIDSLIETWKENVKTFKETEDRVARMLPSRSNIRNQMADGDSFRLTSELYQSWSQVYYQDYEEYCKELF